jgi:folate-binding protein YgfZ
MPELSPLNEQTTAAGATFVEQAGWLTPAHYGDALAEYRATCSGAGLFDVSQRGKVELSGADAGIFLHNLSTNDITGLPIGAGCEAFLTTAQARVVAPFLVYHVLLEGQRGGYWLDVAPGLAEKVIKHLDHFLISEAVDFADRTHEYAQLHLAGPLATQTLATALQQDVPELTECQHMERTFGTTATAHIRRCSALGFAGYDIVCLRNRAGAIWQALVQAGAKPAGLDAHEILRVEAGTPVFGQDITEERLVFDIGRNPQAICFTKGCFLGQEPIVMARDRGHANRKLLGVKLSPGGTVPAGTALLREGKEVGQTTSSVESPRLGQTIALAYLRRGNQEPGTQVEVGTAGSGRTGSVTMLPFA